MLGQGPEEIAKFLAKTTGLNKTMVGEYLGEREDMCLKVMHAYVDAMNFADSQFDEAIRWAPATFIWHQLNPCAFIYCLLFLLEQARTSQNKNVCLHIAGYSSFSFSVPSLAKDGSRTDRIMDIGNSQQQASQGTSPDMVPHANMMLLCCQDILEWLSTAW